MSGGIVLNWLASTPDFAVPYALAALGLIICERLLRIAQIMDRVTVVRSVTHPYAEHGVAYALSGIEMNECVRASRTHRLDDLFDRLKGQIQRDCRFHIVVSRLEVGGYCGQCRTAPAA